MIVRELVALLGIKTEKKGFDNAAGGMNKLVGLAKTAVAAFAAFKGITILKGIVREIAETGDWLDKMSLRTGIATEILQRLGFAAELSGASLNTVETALKKLQVAQIDADAGLTTYKREFDRMGVDIRDAKGELKDTTQLLLEISDGMQGLDTDAERTSVAVKLLGRAGTQLIPMLKDGSGAVREMLEEVGDLGALIDQELIDASAEYLDNQHRMNTVMMAAKQIIAKQLLPVLDEMQVGIIKWWKANRKWVALHLESIFKNLGRTIKNVGGFIVRAVKAVARWISGLGKVPKQVLKIGTAIAVIAGLLEVGLLGKILLVVTAIGLVIDDFEVWRAGGKSVIGDIIAALDDLLGIDVEGTVVAWIDIFAAFGSGIVDFVRFGIEHFMNFVSLLVNVWDDPLEAWRQFTENSKSIGETYGIDIRETFSNIGAFLIADFKALGNSIVGVAKAFLGQLVREWTVAIPDWIKAFFGFKVKGKTIKPPKIPEAVGPIVGAVGPIIEAVGPIIRPTAIEAGYGPLAPVVKVAAPQTNISMNIKATPGMSEKTLASEVGKQVENAVARQNRAAIESLASS